MEAFCPLELKAPGPAEHEVMGTRSEHFAGGALGVILSGASISTPWFLGPLILATEATVIG